MSYVFSLYNLLHILYFYLLGYAIFLWTIKLISLYPSFTFYPSSTTSMPKTDSGFTIYYNQSYHRVQQYLISNNIKPSKANIRLELRQRWLCLPDHTKTLYNNA